MNEKDVVQCQYQGLCSGCDFIGEPLSVQRERKVEHLTSLLLAKEIKTPHIDFKNLALSDLRDRLDFGLEDGRFGLFQTTSKQILDLKECPQLSPSLAEWFSEFRKHLPPVNKASIRLRVSPEGTRGIWLDLANLEAKDLLDESTWLQSWPKNTLIEMGQRRKRVDRTTARPHLKDPELFPWFETHWKDQTVPLFGVIGGFTQPSLLTNRFITSWIQERVLKINPKKILEFGSGQGNLSFPALSGGAKLVACENESLALQGFKQSLESFAEKGFDLRSQVQFEEGDFLRRPSEALEGSDFLLVNPARSGLGHFLDSLGKAKNLKNILSMSCHPETFAEDSAKMAAEQFQIQEILILDQFPQTKHYEILSLWNRSA